LDALPIIPTNFDVVNGATYKSFDPRLVVAYKFSQDVNIYASYSTGFKSGGFQYVPFNVSSANTLFAPEDIKAYEVGLKSEFLDRKLRVNAALYYYDYKNLQVSRIIDTANGPQSLISNAASSTVKGFDLELLMRPSSNLEVNISYGYLDATYDKYIFNIGQSLDFDGTVLVRAPEHTLNVGGQWRIPTGPNSGLTLRADYALVSTFFHEPGEGNPVFGSGIPLTREPGYGLLDLRATFELSDLRVTAYATNATNESYRRTVNALGNAIAGFAGTPRIYGLKVGYSF
jgi:iron complex outermembrane receptor protein